MYLNGSPVDPALQKVVSPLEASPTFQYVASFLLEARLGVPSLLPHSGHARTTSKPNSLKCNIKTANPSLKKVPTLLDHKSNMPKALILVADGSEEIEFVTPYDGKCA